MPLSRLVLLLAVVIFAAAGTIWLASMIGADSISDPRALAIVVPVALALSYVLRRKQ